MLSRDLGLSGARAVGGEETVVGRSLGLCASDQSPGDAGEAGPGTTL